MEDADGGKVSMAAGGEGVDRGPTGSSSTAAAGPFQVQIIQPVVNQLFRLEEKFATLERTMNAVLERQGHAQNLASTTGPPMTESGQRVAESWQFQEKVRPEQRNVRPYYDASFAKFFELKARHMKANNELWEDLLSMMKACKTADESQTLTQKMSEQEELPRACQSVREWRSEERQHHMNMQGWQYSDDWSCVKDSERQVLYAYRCFYMCRAAPAQCACYTAFPGKTWGACHNDPLASKLNCICCGTRYSAHFGLLIEIEISGNYYYVKADGPPGDLEALSLEQTLMPSGPTDLRAMLNHIAPHKDAILRPIRQDEVFDEYTTKFAQNAFKITPDDYETLPRFDWRHILEMLSFGDV